MSEPSTSASTPAPSTPEGKHMSTETPAPKIRLDKVGKTYPGGKVAAVEELSLDIHEGEILVIVEPSGCG